MLITSRNLIARSWCVLALASAACGSQSTDSTFGPEPFDAGPDRAPPMMTGFINIDSGDDAPADGAATAFHNGPTTLDAATKLPGDDCPSMPPSMGATCEQALSCTYDACETTGTTAATCDGQHWTVATVPCAAVSCPAENPHTMCGPGQICQVVKIDGLTAYSCGPNPCGAGPINCRCGAYGGTVTCAGTCVSVEGHQVNCTD
jgi:hypothetical protein